MISRWYLLVFETDCTCLKECTCAQINVLPLVDTVAWFEQCNHNIAPPLETWNTDDNARNSTGGVALGGFNSRIAIVSKLRHSLAATPSPIEEKQQTSQTRTWNAVWRRSSNTKQTSNLRKGYETDNTV